MVFLYLCGTALLFVAVSNLAQASSVYLMSGRSEFMVFLEGRTMRETADFVGQKLAPIDGVISTATSFLLKELKDFLVEYAPL